MNVYLTKVDWYSDYDGEEKHDTCFVFAKSFADVPEQLDRIFDNVFRLTIEETGTSDEDITVLFVPNDEDVIDAIKDANSY